MTNRSYLMLAGGLVVLVMGILAIVISMRLQETAETSQSVAPNAPQSLPKAQVTPPLPNNPVTLTFTVTAPAAPSTPTPTPTASPAGSTAVPTATPTQAPATGGSAATAKPAATATAKAVSTATAKPATASSLPEAGVTAPTIIAIIGGALILAIGVLLAF